MKAKTSSAAVSDGSGSSRRAQAHFLQKATQSVCTPAGKLGCQDAGVDAVHDGTHLPQAFTAALREFAARPHGVRGVVLEAAVPAIMRKGISQLQSTIKKNIRRKASSDLASIHQGTR